MCSAHLVGGHLAQTGRCAHLKDLVCVQFTRVTRLLEAGATDVLGHGGLVFGLEVAQDTVLLQSVDDVEVTLSGLRLHEGLEGSALALGVFPGLEHKGLVQAAYPLLHLLGQHGALVSRPCQLHAYGGSRHGGVPGLDGFLLLELVVLPGVALHQARGFLHDLHTHHHVGREVARLAVVHGLVQVGGNLVRANLAQFHHVQLLLVAPVGHLSRDRVGACAIGCARGAEDAGKPRLLVHDVRERFPAGSLLHTPQELLLLDFVQLLPECLVGKPDHGLEGLVRWRGLVGQGLLRSLWVYVPSAGAHRLLIGLSLRGARRGERERAGAALIAAPALFTITLKRHDGSL